MANVIQMKRGTAAALTSANPTLAAGELCLETDTGKMKIGDGSTAWTSLAYGPKKLQKLNIIFGGAGTEIADNDYRDIEFPACTIKEARVLADQSGSIAIALWKDSYANFPPTNADLIDTFSISTATKSEETGLSLAIAAGSIIRFIVTSCTTITQATLALTVEI